MVGHKRIWLNQNFLCYCYYTDGEPGTIKYMMPKGWVKPECGCIDYVPPIPWTELVGETYETQRR